MRALAIGLGILFIAVALFGESHANRHPERFNQAPVACHEDEPCWNCATMGNERCASSKKGSQ